MSEIQQRKAARTQITKLINEATQLLDDGSTMTDEYYGIRERMDVAKANLDAANEVCIPLMDPAKALDEWAAIFEYRDKLTAIYCKIKRTIERREALETNNQASLNTSATVNNLTNNTRLPRLEIKKFNGELENWLPFWEMFRPTVHENNDISNVVKFGYLQTYLVGKAAKSISGLTPTGTCYEDAIALLLEEYANTSKITESLFKRILETQKVKNARDAVALRRMYNDITASTRSLKALGVQPVQYVVIVKSTLLKCLPETLRLQFLRYENSSPSQSSDRSSTSDNMEDQVKTLLSLLKREVEILEQSNEVGGHSNDDKSSSHNYRRDGRQHETKEQYSAAGLFTTAGEACLFCRSTHHNAAQCTDKTMSINEKKEIIKQNRRCYRCTKPNHNSRECRVKVICAKCKRNHATSMCDPHYFQRHGVKQCNERPRPKQNEAEPISTRQALLATSNVRMCLKTAAAVVLSDKTNQSNESLIRLVIDGGSETSFIRENVANQLQLTTVGMYSISIQPFGCTSPSEPRLCRRVKLFLKNRRSSDIVDILAVVVPDICMDTFKCADVDDPRLNDCVMADVASTTELNHDGISILIGADQYWKVVTGEIKRLTDDLVAVNTKFGWTLHGPNEHSTVRSNIVRVMFTQTSAEVDLSNLWNLDQIGIKQDSIEADEFATQFGKSNIHLQNGRYEVQLPWAYPEKPLHDNYINAKARLSHLLSKLGSGQRFKEYDNIIQDYVRHDIAEVINDDEEVASNKVYYMPHRAVYRNDRETTKVRIVFDASAHMVGQLSLNDLLHSGVNTVPDMIKVLLCFRMYRVAMVADIEKAFLQISLAPEERDCHRFLWVTNDQIKTYRMKRVTFGVTSSPFLLSSTLKHHLDQYDNDIARLLKRSIYVDDVVVGTDDIPAAIALHHEAVNIMKNAGMVLRKWNSNNKRLREEFGCVAKDQKVLGLRWHVLSDEISVDITALINYLKENPITSKRNVLQVASRVFDPIGMLNHFVITIKILIQDLWKLKIKWEQRIPNDIEERFHKWSNQLLKVDEFRIPRNVNADKVFQLHIFSDASERAYGAVAYFKGSHECQFVMSRARVAPLKSRAITLPQLELTAALMAARLYYYITSTINDSPSEAYIWSDSKIALHWIRGKPDRWKPYVANRVREIQTLTTTLMWKHCPGKDNPADILSRGIRADDCPKLIRWKFGPSWLNESKSRWPVEEDDYMKEDLGVFAVTVCSDVEKEEVIPLSRFSSLSKLLMVTYYVLMFTKKIRKINLFTNKIGIINELWHEAENYWVRRVQLEHYREEIHELGAGKSVPKHSSLVKLSPYLDTNGILRLTGRLQYSKLPVQNVHPVILPKTSHYTNLLIWDAHERLHHSGVNAVNSKLREKYWVIRGRQAIKSVINTCVMCQRLRKLEIRVPTAPLPTDRVAMPMKAFEKVGVDFAGPLYIRHMEQEKSKVYIALFTCANSRAVHLELVGSMNADTFILALRRFFARHGVPKCMLSDNAKVFKKTGKELRAIYEILNEVSVEEELKRQRIEWKFIVELAPWWGGFWERLVRSVKTALKSTLNRRTLTFDELRTVLIEIESTINQRPLTYLSDDIDSLQPLRPIDLLMGTSAYNSLNIPNIGKRLDILNVWSAQQKVVERFWKIWQTDYLQHLRSANMIQCNRVGQEVKPGMVMILKDQNEKRLNWKLVRVTQVFQGRDGKVRSCEIKTGKGTLLKRAVQLLIPLEFQEEVLRTPPPGCGKYDNAANVVM